jgi:SAM-dependent methyltransferase
MGFFRFMAAQFRKPNGWFGTRILAPVMNHGNRKLIESALTMLDIKPQHQVLEIGFGGGSALGYACKRLRGGIVTGIDFSQDMVDRAQDRFRREIAESRMAVQFGDISKLPFPDASFDCVFTINTIYFWPDTMKGMEEIRRVLKPDGRVAVGYRSKEVLGRLPIAQYGFQLFDPEEVADLMRQAGFSGIQMNRGVVSKMYDNVVTVGTRR